MRHSFETLPLDYASYHIHTGGLKQAIEAIERGRGLLWSEIRHFRTSIDEIRLADSRLADQFLLVNKDLEKLSVAFSPNNNVNDGGSDLEGMGPFGRLVMQQQQLLDDREKLISQIQALPDFDTFFKPHSFNFLQYSPIGCIARASNHYEPLQVEV